jgi:hypothetical protein
MEALVRLILWGTFRFEQCNRLYVWLSFWMIGVYPATAQPVFAPYEGPTHAFPGTWIAFSVYTYHYAGYPPTAASFDLVAAPTNATFDIIWDRPGELFALTTWSIPPNVAVGTTNDFVIRATDDGTPPLSSTLTVSITLVEPPLIETPVISNGVVALRFNNPIEPTAFSDQAYRILWSGDLATTNWLELCTVGSRAPLITLTDTNGLLRQRFYRVAPYGWEYGYGP